MLDIKCILRQYNHNNDSGCVSICMIDQQNIHIEYIQFEEIIRELSQSFDGLLDLHNLINKFEILGILDLLELLDIPNVFYFLVSTIQKIL